MPPVAALQGPGTGLKTTHATINSRPSMHVSFMSPEHVLGTTAVTFSAGVSRLSDVNPHVAEDKDRSERCCSHGWIVLWVDN